MIPPKKTQNKHTPIEVGRNQGGESNKAGRRWGLKEKTGKTTNPKNHAQERKIVESNKKARRQKGRRAKQGEVLTRMKSQVIKTNKTSTRIKTKQERGQGTFRKTSTKHEKKGKKKQPQIPSPGTSVMLEHPIEVVYRNVHCGREGGLEGERVMGPNSTQTGLGITEKERKKETDRGRRKADFCQ